MTLADQGYLKEAGSSQIAVVHSPRDRVATLSVRELDDDQTCVWGSSYSSVLANLA
jgi:hypothetical protein